MTLTDHWTLRLLLNRLTGNVLLTRVRHSPLSSLFTINVASPLTGWPNVYLDVQIEMKVREETAETRTKWNTKQNTNKDYYMGLLQTFFQL